MPFHHSEPPNAFPAAPFPPTRPNSAKHISATSDSSTPLTSENRTESTRRLRRTSPDMESRESTRKRGVRTDSLRSGRIERTDTFLGLRNGVPVSRRPMGAVVCEGFCKAVKAGQPNIKDNTYVGHAKSTPGPCGDFVRLYAARNRGSPAEIAGSASRGAERTKRTHRRDYRTANRRLRKCWTERRSIHKGFCKAVKAGLRDFKDKT
ncbi:hypothetical protein C8R43DRAFT_127303 [Mycena crocata]|nr:hypothetical protein C8R43DRAFT_127303 [Mycena crocata]